MKTLELIGFFNEFREGSLNEIMKRHLSSQEKEDYINRYISYKIIEAKIDRKIAKENDKSVLKVRDENRA